MNKELKAHIEYLLCINVEQIQLVSGGDVSKAYLLKTESERFFCKVNQSPAALDMFLAEKAGLAAIARTKTIATPKVLVCEALTAGGFLVMEYVTSKQPSSKDMALFGHQLAALHKMTSSESFGWDAGNFIGRLPQANSINSVWADFYVQERLLPQLRLARANTLLRPEEIPSETQLLKRCENSFADVSPSLVHGDLWRGNFLISENGVPNVIDPAVYFGHHEVDIAMTRLFGGFDNSFYKAYAEHFPAIGGEKERSDIYQLYFLLVHLNMFGTSYHAPCKEILERYF